jgi:hypothetical protein
MVLKSAHNSALSSHFSMALAKPRLAHNCFYSLASPSIIILSVSTNNMSTRCMSETGPNTIDVTTIRLLHKCLSGHFQPSAVERYSLWFPDRHFLFPQHLSDLQPQGLLAITRSFDHLLLCTAETRALAASLLQPWQVPCGFSSLREKPLLKSRFDKQMLAVAAAMVPDLSAHRK